MFYLYKYGAEENGQYIEKIMQKEFKKPKDALNFAKTLATKTGSYVDVICNSMAIYHRFFPENRSE